MPKRAPSAAAPAPFTSAEVAAIAGAIKDTAVDTAKRELPDGGLFPVDLTVRIQGSVQKGHGNPGGTFDAPADVNLMTVAAFASILRFCQIGKKRLSEALNAIQNPSDLPVDAEFSELFAYATERLRNSLPRQPKTTTGKRGSVTASVSVTRV